MPIQIEITTESSPDFSALGLSWMKLEARASVSFFQSWSWIGCQRERWTAPVLVRATRGEGVVGLALFNRWRGALHLHQSGDPRLDTPYVERNGPLLAEGVPQSVARAMLAVAWRDIRPWRLVLPGVHPSLVTGLPGVPAASRLEPAPIVDLGRVRAAGGDVLALASSNTRQQVRRSFRGYGAQGDVGLDAAASLDEARRWLHRLAVLHQLSWTRRGEPGAFASASFRRFHDELLDRCWPAGQVELLRLRAGAEELGYLHNFRLAGVTYAYQSGFADGDLTAHDKPGLMAHVLAIRAAAARGDDAYDFLGGRQRYKRSLAGEDAPLCWAEMVPARTPAGMLAIARRWARTTLRRTGEPDIAFRERIAGVTRRVRSGSSPADAP